MKKNDRFSNLYLDLGFAQLVPEWKKLIAPKELKQDLLAGLTVACLAIPLSLSIALASGAPPELGLLTSIVAGIVCSLFGGTPLAVSGPAAAMAVLVGTVLQKYGMSTLLWIGMSCGVLQVLSGILGFGKWIRFVPLPVVSGLTAGIGAIILISQLPRALGLPAPDQSHAVFVITHVKDYIGHTQAAPLFLSLGTLAITLGLPRLSPRIPAALIGVVTMTAVAVVSGMGVESIEAIPRSFFSIHMPPSPKLPRMELAELVFVFFALASLETFLSSSAVDKLKGGKRHDPSQELIGQGLGNFCSALFGGIPVTGVIARSVLNVQVGAKTRRASVFHSLFILIAVLSFAPWIERIPVAVLAGILISVALKMMHPGELYNLWKVSKIEAAIYLITFSTIIGVDLIAGVQTGMIVAMVILAIRLSQTRSRKNDSEHLGAYRFIMQGPVTFMSSGKFEEIRDALEEMEDGRGVIIDMTRVTTVDASGAEQMVELVKNIVQRGSRVALQGLTEFGQKVLKASDQANFIQNTFAASENEVQQVLKDSGSDSPLERLIFGVKRFQGDSRSHYKPLFDLLAKQQDPHTLFIACSDSRISPNLITSTDPGELFIVRNVGNIIPPYGHDQTPAEGAAVEFAIAVLGIKEIVVCGHSGCGAMKTIVNRTDLSHLPDLKKWLEDSKILREQLPLGCSHDDAARLNALIQLENLKTYPIVKKKLESGEIRLHAWFYDIGPGEILWWDHQSKIYVTVESISKSFRDVRKEEKADPSITTVQIGTN